jgi:hypothetical protein
MVNSQALAAVVEVHAPDKKGEVHVLAGGIDEAFAGGQRGDDALVTLRGANTARFRVELRLPGDNGSLGQPNQDRGDLKTRPLAKLMRYCEEYVLTCDLDAWRGSETCRVEYRRGNIARTLVGGIDAPEQLAEVMGWTSGNYRFVLPRLALPTELDSAHRAQAKAAADTRIAEQKAARKTIYGMPAAQIPGVAAAAGSPVPAPIPVSAGAAGGAPAAAQAAAPAAPAAPVQAAPAAKTMFFGSAGQAATAQATAAPIPTTQSGGPAKTIIGMAPAVVPRQEPKSAPPPTSSAPSVVVDSGYGAQAEPTAPPQRSASTPAQPARRESVPQQTERGASKAPKGKGTKAQAARAAAESSKLSPAPAKTGGSTWASVGIMFGVAAAIIVIWLLISMLNK